MSQGLRLSPSAFLLGLGLLAGCSETQTGAERQAGISWQAIEYPLFERIDAECSARASAVASERRAGTVNHTKPPSEIQWAQTFPEAIERATREGKPIFIASSVRKGADPEACDV